MEITSDIPIKPYVYSVDRNGLLTIFENTDGTFLAPRVQMMSMGLEETMLYEIVQIVIDELSTKKRMKIGSSNNAISHGAAP